MRVCANFNLNRNLNHSQTGFILATTLIFLAVLSLLIVSLSENCILEIKMSKHDAALFIAQTAAESQLAISENELSGSGGGVAPDLGAVVSSKITLQNIDNCNRADYLIDVVANSDQAEYHLRSLYQVVKIDSIPPACIGQPMVNHRVWWQLI